MAKALSSLLAPVVPVSDSRHILIAVNDDAIPAVASELAAGGLRGAVVLHTSGAAGPDALQALRSTGNSVGVLHPLQTVPSAQRGIESLPGASYAFAGDAAAVEWARSLIARLGGRELEVDPRLWELYHAAAVMASNYHVTLVDSALELMETAGIARAAALTALAPIVRATTENLLEKGPERALTGPIARGDIGTVCKHLEGMKCVTAETRRLYIAAGLRTIPLAQRSGLAEHAASELALAFGVEGQ